MEKKSCFARYEMAIVITLVFVSLFFVFNLLEQCHRGIDFTDEGFYINWIVNPWLYKSSVTQFGYIYHPLYQLLGENLVLLRQADMVMLLGLSWIVCIQLLHDVFPRDELKRKGQSFYIYGIALGLATTIFAFFGAIWWLPTPSYNSLALEAALIISIAVLALSKDSSRLTAYVILGFGYWLMLMAKPISAVLIGICSCLYLLLIEGKQFKVKHYLLACGIAIVMMCLSAWMIDGSIGQFIIRLHTELDLRRLISGGWPLSGFMPTYGWLPEEPKRSVFFLFIMMTYLIISLSSKKYATAQDLCLSVLLCLGFLVVNNTYIVPLDRMESLAQGLLTQALILVVPLGALLSCFVMLCQRRSHIRHIKPVYLSLYFFVLPCLCTYGTLMDFWTNALRLGFFYVVAMVPLIILTTPKLGVRWRMVLSLIVCSQVITMALVQQAMEHPYHQKQPLRLQHETLDIFNTQGKKSTSLIVSDHDARYIRELRQTAWHHGFSYGDFLLDLSDSPTSSYVLGAKAIGAPWFDMGLASQTPDLLYDYLRTVLLTIPCDELMNAWVLIPQNYHHQDVVHVLKRYGLDQSRLEPVVDIIHQQDTYHGFVRHKQLWKPVHTQEDKILFCEKNHTAQWRAQDLLRKLWKGSCVTTQSIIERSRTDLNENKAAHVIAFLKEATFLNPWNAYLYNNFCVAYGIEKKYKQAILACSQALHLSPDFQWAKNNLAWVEHEK